MPLNWPTVFRIVHLLRAWPGFIGLLAFSSAFAADSEWISRDWQVDDGLPNNTVVSVVQTTDGFLWVGNSAGVARFDGVRFEAFPTQDLLGGTTPTRLRRFIGGRRDTLWAAVDPQSIIRLQSGKRTVFTNGFPDAIANGLAEDAEGALWIAFRSGTVCRLKDGAVTRFTSQSEIPPGTTCSFATDREGTLWFAKGGSLGVFRDGKFQTLQRLDSPTAVLAPSRAGGIWIAGLELQHYVEGGELQSYGAIPATGTRGRPMALLEDRGGRVWIGTAANGLFCYDGHGFESVPVSDLEISSLTEDREGNLWVGTSNGGVNRIGPRTVHLETAETGLPAAIQSTCQTPGGDVWAVTLNGALIRKTSAGWTSVPTNADWPGGVASCVAAGPAGEIWIGTVGRALDRPALYRWKDGRFGVFHDSDGLKPRSIHALLVSRTGDVWVGGEGPDTVQCLKAGATEFKTFKLPAETRHIAAMIEDANGSIWVGGHAGMLFRIDGDRVTNETRTEALKSIRSFHVTKDGTLWIAYGGCGVGRLKAGRFSLVGAGQGLYRDTISQVTSDDRGWLWFGSDGGIFKVRQKELEAVAEGRSARVESVHYGNEQGLPGLRARFGDWPAVSQDRDGQIWMPMRTALAVIHPHQSSDDDRPPPVLLISVTVDDQPLARYGGTFPVAAAVDLQRPGAGIAVPPGPRRLQFGFTALDFGAPENVHFRYRLQGFEERWIDGGTLREANYSALPAGKYRFQVTACNSDGVWNERGVDIAVVVAPFFWQTWWFCAGAAAAFMLAMIIAVRYVSYRRLRSQLHLLEQQAALDKERRRIARDIHDDLGGSLTQIAMLSDLALEDHAKPEESGRHVAQIATRAREGIRSLDEIVWAVNPSNDTLNHLVDYIGQAAVDFFGASRIRCFVDLPEELPDYTVFSEVRHHLFLVVKETLNNIVRHARATEVRVSAAVSAGRLEIRIEDNGQGFDGTPAGPYADGLQNMTERMRAIGGEFQIETGPGSGTRVLLRLRLSEPAGPQTIGSRPGPGCG